MASSFLLVVLPLIVIVILFWHATSVKRLSWKYACVGKITTILENVYQAFKLKKKKKKKKKKKMRKAVGSLFYIQIILISMYRIWSSF